MSNKDKDLRTTYISSRAVAYNRNTTGISRQAVIPVQRITGDKEIEDETHLGEVADGEGEGGIKADAGAEALAEVLVGAHADDVAEERHDDRTDESEDTNKEDSGDEQ